MQKPVVLFLVGGLRYRDYPTRQRIIPEAGFRHAEVSLLTGEPVARHGVWTDYGFSPTSPFKTVSRLPGLGLLWRCLNRSQKRHLNFLIYRLSEALSGVPLPKSSLIPPHSLARALPTQRAAPDARDAYPGFDSVFDLLRAEKRCWLYLGPPRLGSIGTCDSLVEKKLYTALGKRTYHMYYIRLGDLDRASRIYGPDSSQAEQCRAATRRRIESMKSEIKHVHGDLRWMLVSDHGFVAVRELVPVPEWITDGFARGALSYYFVDSTILRLWLRDSSDPDGLERRLADFEYIEPVDENTCSSLGIEPGTHQMGHITYLCHKGMVFWPDFFSVRPPQGMYGYLPTNDLACPVETYGMPALPETVNHALLGQLVKQTIGDA